MPLGITKGLLNWKSQDQSVERFTDNAAYTSAHPDDTLVLAGLPRLVDVRDGNAESGSKSLLAIGMLQGFQFSSQKPTQPIQAIGSGRLFFVSGKSQTQWNIGRLFCNGRNLNRALYHSAVASNINPQFFDDPAVRNNRQDMYYINLDSELFYLPFGLCSIFRDKAKDLIGGVYLELAIIQSYSVGFNAGQNMILESVSGMCDRVMPYAPSNLMVSMEGRRSLDVAIGFDNPDSVMMPTNGQTLPEGVLSDASANSEIA